MRAGPSWLLVAVLSPLFAACQGAQPEPAPMSGASSEDRPAAPSADHLQAQQLCRQAEQRLERRTPQTLREARDLYVQASRLDPQESSAHAGEAICSALLALYGAEPPAAAWPRARQAAQVALERNPREAEAWAAQGLIAFLADRDDAAANLAFQTAIELDGGNASLWHWWAMVARAGGDSELALQRLHRALALAPQARILRVKRGTLLAEAGRLEEALSQLQTVLLEDPEFASAHRAHGMALLRAQRPQEAALAYERAWACSPGSGASAAGACYAWALAGRVEEARGWQARVPQRDPLHLAVAHSALDEGQAAALALRQAFAVQDPGRVYLDVHPTFARLIAGPEGQAWLSELRLR